MNKPIITWDDFAEKEKVEHQEPMKSWNIVLRFNYCSKIIQQKLTEKGLLILNPENWTLLKLREVGCENKTLFPGIVFPELDVF